MTEERPDIHVQATTGDIIDSEIAKARGWTGIHVQTHKPGKYGETVTIPSIWGTAPGHYKPVTIHRCTRSLDVCRSVCVTMNLGFDVWETPRGADTLPIEAGACSRRAFARAGNLVSECVSGCDPADALARAILNALWKRVDSAEAWKKKVAKAGKPEGTLTL